MNSSRQSRQFSSFFSRKSEMSVIVNEARGIGSCWDIMMMIKRPGGSSSMTTIRTFTSIPLVRTQQYNDMSAVARSNQRYALSVLCHQYSSSSSSLRNGVMCTKKKMYIFRTNPSARSPSISVWSSSRYNYSSTRHLNESDKNNNKGATASTSTSPDTSTSSTLMDGITSFSNQLFNVSTKIVEKSATEASNVASSVAKKTLDGTQKLTSNALSESQKLAEKAAQQASTTASTFARKTLDETQKLTTAALSESQKLAQRAAKDTTKLASESFRQVSTKTKQKVSQTVQENVSKPIQQTSKKIKDSSGELVETITSSGTKLLKWFAWWSLAAVAVYGLVSTLPIALIKYAMERKNNDDDQTKNPTASSATTKDETTDTKSGGNNNNRGVWSSIRGIFSSSPSKDN
mmetsp:Transcript_38173/g.92842  ORF Transcript_38173/g.92842 Transcript_38173/m.92842 type:complete len:404 (+) Transcript_38173:90-1301(+)